MPELRIHLITQSPEGKIALQVGSCEIIGNGTFYYFLECRLFVFKLSEKKVVRWPDVKFIKLICLYQCYQIGSELNMLFVVKVV